MSVTILDTLLEGQAVRVTAADFNGSTFDGNPFSDGPDWLKNAITSEKITIYPDDRDYACWKVLTPNGEVIAEPGDLIMHRPGTGLTVYTRKIGK